MSRQELVQQFIQQAMEDFSTYDLSDMDAAYHNLLEDFAAKCSDQELNQLMDTAQ